MCFASVYFQVKDKGVLELFDKGDKEKNITYEYYKSEPIEYLLRYFLKNTLDNLLSKNIFHHIKNWYETGAYSKEIVLSIIHSINNYEEKVNNYYSSQEEITQFIQHTDLY